MCRALPLFVSSRSHFTDVLSSAAHTQGKTLQAISLLYTLVRQGFEAGKPVCRRALIVCPTSLVSNWRNELAKWCGDRIKCVALSESNKEKVISGISDYLNPRGEFPVLIISYETFRLHVRRLKGPYACDLMICDEAHRLKNDETATYKALNSLPCLVCISIHSHPCTITAVLWSNSYVICDGCFVICVIETYFIVRYSNAK